MFENYKEAFGIGYSKEAFENEEEVANAARHQMEKTDERRKEGKMTDQERKQYRTSRDVLHRAEERMKKLLASGQSEAIALNEKYERLKREAEEALDKLGQFEVDELGMKPEDEE